MINLKDILFEVSPEISAKYGDVLFGDKLKFAHLQKRLKNQILQKKINCLIF